METGKFSDNLRVTENGLVSGVDRAFKSSNSTFQNIGDRRNPFGKSISAVFWISTTLKWYISIRHLSFSDKQGTLFLIWLDFSPIKSTDMNWALFTDNAQFPIQPVVPGFFFFEKRCSENRFRCLFSGSLGWGWVIRKIEIKMKSCVSLSSNLPRVIDRSNLSPSGFTARSPSGFTARSLIWSVDDTRVIWVQNFASDLLLNFFELFSFQKAFKHLPAISIQHS